LLDKNSFKTLKQNLVSQPKYWACDQG